MEVSTFVDNVRQYHGIVRCDSWNFWLRVVHLERKVLLWLRNLYFGPMNQSLVKFVQSLRDLSLHRYIVCLVPVVSC